MRRFAGAIAVALLATACGAAGREAAPAQCLVRVYFCTGDTCARPATRAQMRLVERRVRKRDDVYSVRFISKIAALRLMEKKHPEMAQIPLPANPLPDSLRIRPLKGVPPARIAAALPEGRTGVEHVRPPRASLCD
jgi:cell division protein FtsX